MNGKAADFVFVQDYTDLDDFQDYIFEFKRFWEI
jgi:hypothetical protein